MGTPVVWLLVHHPPSKQTGAVSLNLPLEDTNLGFLYLLIQLDSWDFFCLSQAVFGRAVFGYLRSSKHADGRRPVEAVPAHQVGNVILEFHFLPGESSSLKQLSSGRVVVLSKNTSVRTSFGGNVHLIIAQTSI